MKEPNRLSGGAPHTIRDPSLGERILENWSRMVGLKCQRTSEGVRPPRRGAESLGVFRGAEDDDCDDDDDNPAAAVAPNWSSMLTR